MAVELSTKTWPDEGGNTSAACSRNLPPNFFLCAVRGEQYARGSGAQGSDLLLARLFKIIDIEPCLRGGFAD